MDCNKTRSFSVLAIVSSNWSRSRRLFTYREISRYHSKLKSSLGGALSTLRKAVECPRGQDSIGMALFTETPAASRPAALRLPGRKGAGKRFQAIDFFARLTLGFQGMGDVLEEDKERLCGDPSHQHESASRYGQHQERAEMMIRHFDGAAGVFLARRESLPDLVGGSQTFEPPARKDTGRRDEMPRRPAVPPRTRRTWTSF